MSWPGPLFIEEGPAIHSSVAKMDGVRTLPLLTKGGHDKKAR